MATCSPPQLLSDVCRTIHEQPSASRPLVECLARAIELDAWRQKLTRSVYEAHLLELVHRFQFGFVKQIAAFDTVVGESKRGIYRSSSTSATATALNLSSLLQ